MTFRQVQRLSEARRQAVTDDLTGLGNRRSLFEHGMQLLDSAEAAERLALILIDLDNFKEINDSFGHPAGDELLREIARRLTARATEHDLLVRLGGDEFAVLITLAPNDDSRQIATAILDRITEPFIIDGARLLVKRERRRRRARRRRARIVDLLRRADVAMYAAKDSHLPGGALRPANSTRSTGSDSRRSRISTPRSTSTSSFCTTSRRSTLRPATILGAEALVRWQHPTRGLLYPDAFLPIVEQIGLMHAVTRDVLEAAVRQVAIWKEDGLDITTTARMVVGIRVEIVLAALVVWVAIWARVTSLVIHSSFAGIRHSLRSSRIRSAMPWEACLFSPIWMSAGHIQGLRRAKRTNFEVWNWPSGLIKRLKSGSLASGSLGT